MYIKNFSLTFANRLWLVLLLIIIFVLVIVTTKCNLGKIEQHASLETFTHYLDERIPAIMKNYDIPGANIALIQRGETVWVKAYGYADLEHHRKMTVDAICRVESISKSVTAWGVMRLVEQGLIELDEPIQKYLGDWELPKTEYDEEKITVRRLLSHNAGMPLGTIGPAVEYAPGSPMPSLREFLTQETRLVREPGSGFSYSNSGFNLLELLVEAVTGQDFAAYLADEVLMPLSMHNSSFCWNEKWRSLLPMGYELNGSPVPPYVYPVKASGGLLASVTDIARFVSAGMNGSFQTRQTVLTSESIHQLYAAQTAIPGIFGLVADSYSFGHFIENFPDGRKAVWHGGQGHGWMTHFHSVPETGDGIVILTNSQRSWPLIAYLLNDWAAWNGFSSVGMGQIIRGQKALWVLIALLTIVALWQLWRLVQGLISGKRRFAPLSKKSRCLRLVQSSLFIALISVLLWAVNQDYLFISSVFPIASGWLGYSIFLCAVVLLLSALFPCVKMSNRTAV